MDYLYVCCPRQSLALEVSFLAVAELSCQALELWLLPSQVTLVDLPWNQQNRRYLRKWSLMVLLTLVQQQAATAQLHLPFSLFLVTGFVFALQLYVMVSLSLVAGLAFA